MLEITSFDGFKVQVVYHGTISPDGHFMTDDRWDRETQGDMWDHEERIKQMRRERQGDDLAYGTRRYGRNMVKLQCSWGACYSIDKENS